MRVTVRDREILRFVARVHVVNTLTVTEAFFSHRRPAQRALARLREHGLIASTQNGLRPGASQPRYWHLTERGRGLMEQSFPGEPLSRLAGPAAARRSLRYWEHLDAVARLYAQVIRAEDARAARTKADAIVWAGDHAVKLELARGRKLEAVIPDATVHPRDGGARIFIEVDRSTETLRRCKQVVGLYARFCAGPEYTALFEDTRRPYVLYVTKSAARRDNLRKATRGLARDAVEVAALTSGEAVAWLHEALFGARHDLLPADAAPAEPRVGARRALEVLTALYDDYYATLRRLEDRGEDVEWPGSLHQAHALLEGGERGPA